MKLRNLKISKQLNIGLSVIFLLVVLLGAIALFNSDSLWQNAKGLYDRILTVRRAIGAIQTDVLYIRVEMKELILKENEQKIQESLIAINTYEADAYRQLDVLIERYLGSRSDIDNAYNSVVQWKPIRDEAIRLLRAGKLDEAAERTKIDGIDEVQTEKVMSDLAKINDFAMNKGEQLYMDAQRQKNQNILQLVIILGTILLLSMGISTFLRKGILTPLKELTSATEAFQQGKLEARSRYVSANEFGMLSKCFNFMVETVQSEIQNKENIAKVSAAMILQDDLHLFCQELLKTLMKHTGSQVGAVYLLNGQKTDYEHFESIGLNAGVRATFSASGQEGEFGSVLVTRQIQQVTDIPSNTKFTFSTVSGDFKPKEILTIPVLDGSDIVAVISLTSIHNYPAAAVRLVDDIWGELTARLNGVLAFQQTNEFSHKLQHTNRELEAQTKELAMQADELSEQNIELEMQKKLLDKASQLKNSFLSNMSHELLTPLNSVIALASVLNRRLRGAIPEDEYGYLDVIERNGKHLLSLVNDILDISRIEAGKEEITISRFTIRKLVGEVVEMIEPQAQEKEIALLNHVSGYLPGISSDISMCRHILQNIISNAVKFTKEGSVEISAALVDTDFQISITDTGIGIAEDQLQYIFNEFRQADETTSRKYGGTGLGLAIAKKYAGLLRGSIAVRSELGEGSTFTLKLPLTFDPSATGEKAQSMEFRGVAKSMGVTAPSTGQGKCILLVEDSEPAIIQMKDILTEQGYQVLIARNGKEALENIEKVLPDAMILDLMLPEVDGFQVLKAIRSVEETGQIPVLILTAKHITKEELSFLKGNHIFQLIQKGSIGKTELLAAVRNMVWKQSEQQTPPAEKPARTPILGRPVILVVEDNVDNITTVKALLKETCDIIEATDGQAGIDQAKTHSPALILLDISLPVMDGFQVLKELRSEESLRHIPVIALTARAMTGDREEILAYGFDGYVSKPIDDKLLEKTIRGILDAK